MERRNAELATEHAGAIELASNLSAELREERRHGGAPVAFGAALADGYVFSNSELERIFSNF